MILAKLHYIMTNELIELKLYSAISVFWLTSEKTPKPLLLAFCVCVCVCVWGGGGGGGGGDGGVFVVGLINPYNKQSKDRWNETS